ncbi:MAG: hypothetical protein GF313_00435 [Caldithrix sp.]|nr:hypothetical protein [Caldithrix sp.]
MKLKRINYYLVETHFPIYQFNNSLDFNIGLRHLNYQQRVSYFYIYSEQRSVNGVWVVTEREKVNSPLQEDNRSSFHLALMPNIGLSFRFLDHFHTTVKYIYKEHYFLKISLEI